MIERYYAMKIRYELLVSLLRFSKLIISIIGTKSFDFYVDGAVVRYNLSIVFNF